MVHRCANWIFSTDGTTFRHPDAPAIARLLPSGHQPRPMLGVNVPSASNCWWDDDSWRGLVSYEPEYGDDIDGLTISFEAARAG